MKINININGKKIPFNINWCRPVFPNVREEALHKYKDTESHLLEWSSVEHYTPFYKRPQINKNNFLYLHLAEKILFLIDLSLMPTEDRRRLLKEVSNVKIKESSYQFPKDMNRKGYYKFLYTRFPHKTCSKDLTTNGVIKTIEGKKLTAKEKEILLQKKIVLIDENLVSNFQLGEYGKKGTRGTKKIFIGMNNNGEYGIIGYFVISS